MVSKKTGNQLPEVVLRYKKVLYKRAWTMTAITTALALLAIWQREFVMSGITANPYLNLSILAGLVFGVSLTFYQLAEMRDDFTALDGLYEALDDVRGMSEPRQRKARILEREARLKQPATLFAQPRLLGSGYLLLSQEIARRGVLSIPNSTKKLLLDETEERIDTRANFTAYVGSLMVLLGLLGTFIGLMETVGSVGTIISELDLSGSAGPDAIQNLISNLRAPLNGMATGFSSSLFGLIASLVIGVLGRVVGTAYNALRSDFEHWINQLARIESGNNTKQPPEAPAAAPAATGSPDDDFANALHAGEEQLLWRAVRTSIVAQAGLRDQIGGLIESAAADRTARQAEMEILRGILHRNDKSLAQQRAAFAVITNAPEAMTKAAESLSASVDQLRHTVDRRGPNRAFGKPARPDDTKQASAPPLPRDATIDDWLEATANQPRSDKEKRA